MAKGRVGVLEAHDNPVSGEPRVFCGRAIAYDMVCAGEAIRLGKRRIQMVTKRAGAAVEHAPHARTLRELAESAARRLTKSPWIDGLTTAGNVLALSRLHNSGDKLHYEIPMAGDRSCFARHRRPLLQVSGKSRIARAVIAANFAPIVPTVLPFAIAATA